MYIFEIIKESFDKSTYSIKDNSTNLIFTFIEGKIKINVDCPNVRCEEQDLTILSLKTEITELK